MFEVMLIGLLVLVLILIPLCIGFVAIVRWIMRRTRRVSGQTPVTAAEPLPPPGAAEKGVVRTESLTAEDTFAFETSGLDTFIWFVLHFPLHENAGQHALLSP